MCGRPVPSLTMTGFKGEAMSNVITNRMDRPWTFVAPGWAFSFTLKPLEMRVLSDEEAKAVSANPSVARLVDSGLLAMDTPKKDAEAVNTVAQTQKRVKDAEKSEVLTAPSGNKAATVKTEIKGTSSVLVK